MVALQLTHWDHNPPIIKIHISSTVNTVVRPKRAAEPVTSDSMIVCGGYFWWVMIRPVNNNWPELDRGSNVSLDRLVHSEWRSWSDKHFRRGTGRDEDSGQPTKVPTAGMNKCSSFIILYSSYSSPSTPSFDLCIQAQILSEHTMTMRGSGHILISQWKILNMIFMSHRATTVDVPLESQGNYLLLAQKWMLTCIGL